ncbi:hypothetical protein [Oscillatoria salina]|uniref:hypothetical protein n=1 Tax=Oscillatoria salina TaxID=331517 RepID=UPI0013BAAF4D|nr:hypothetical protein [Oscillatoria salina]MBZ8180527.1 hypothetical protein [Oscillatoria salina IIICB1]NET88970.1 hypothetical protein [Kamptonema sp. SIO1D9]
MVNYQRDFLRLEPPGYQKALKDFAVLELLEKLAQINESNLISEELENLAALLIKQLINNLNFEVISTYLHGIRQGESAVIADSLVRSRMLPIPVDSPAFFLDATTPRFPFGSVVSWLPIDEPELTDWGVVIGRYYGYAPESGNWKWCYLLLLDPDSPSARWCVVDTAWETDLEKFEDE